MISADNFSRLLHQPELLQEVSTEELEQLCKQFPWFGAAQLLLAAKKKQENAADTHQQIQKAAIFFNQSLQFNKELNGFASISKNEMPQAESTFFSEEDKLVDETDAAINAETLIETETLQEEYAAPVSEEYKLMDETDAAIDAETLIETETLQEEYAAPVSDAVLDAEVLIEAETQKEEKEAEINDSVLDAETILQAEMMKEEREATITDDVLDAEAMVEAETQREEQQTEPEPETSNLQPATKPQPEPAFSFEPFHTVDYFASQGIKLLEDKSNDKLGQQVKSFTQWLKSMKKIYVEEKKELDESEEKAVVNKASESNQQQDIITEAMADVLVKQGKRAQAAELYRKLSLLHPEKSAYFASLIEELKS